jgi:hypothetical protein
VTAAWQLASAVFVTLWHTATGGWLVAVELTVIVNVQVFVLPAASVATHLTIVEPTEKAEPEAGTQFALTPGQLSETTGAGKFTTTLIAPGGAFVTMFPGQLIMGN